MTLNTKMAIHNLLGHPETLNLIKNVEDTVVFLTQKVFKSDHNFSIISCPSNNGDYLKL